MKQPSYIVFQCYGNEGVFLECAFALLSLSRLYEPEELRNLQIWIYTDKPEWFQKFTTCTLPLHFRQVDMATIQKWRGAIDFVHRVKIEVLLDFTREHKGNILYADTDIIFTHRMDDMWRDIEAGQLYMHMLEAKVSDKSNPILKKLDRHLRATHNTSQNSKPLYEMDMWNAGILGFNTSYIPLLQAALEYTDAEYPKFPKHIIEQFAFSVQFQTKGKLKAALPYVLHYWNMKEVRIIFKSFFAHFNMCTWAELTTYSGMLQMYELVLRKIRFQYNRTLSEKILNKPWKPEHYNWDELLKQL